MSGAHQRTLTARLVIDHATFSKMLVFNRPISPSECSAFLFGDSSRASVCKSAGLSGRTGSSDRFLINTRDGDVVMRMRADIRQAIIGGSIINSVGTEELPRWVPDHARKAIYHGLKRGVTRFQTKGEWGDIVAWYNGSKLELYQEFPASRSFYDRHFGRDGRYLHFAYTLFNKDMREFVDGRGLSPDEARARIRKINDEVLALILGGVVEVMGTAAAGSQMMAAMRNSGPKLSAAASRSPRFKASEAGIVISDAERPLIDALRRNPRFSRLTAEELAAIRSYSGEGWADINLFLRYGAGGPKAEAEAGLLASALSKLPAYTGTLTRSEGRAVEDALSTYKKGSTITMKAPYSASRGGVVAQREGNVGLVIHAIGKGGRDISEIAVHGAGTRNPELEVLFSPGSRFLVEDVMQFGQGFMVTLREL